MWRRLFNQDAAELEKWRLRLTPLERQAFELAVRRWQLGAPLAGETLAETLRLQQELRALAQELRDRHPKVYRVLAPVISEALLDFNYALKVPPAVSLRFHHYLEAQEGRASGGEPARDRNKLS
jgi:hypothetical protein